MRVQLGGGGVSPLGNDQEDSHHGDMEDFSSVPYVSMAGRCGQRKWWV